MGIVFVIIIHLIVIGILSAIIAAILTIVTHFASSQSVKARNILISIVSPFVALYTFYIFGLVGIGIVSTINNIDIGTGDVWYIPLPNDCQLLFIDLPEVAFIEKNGRTVISNVSQLQQFDNIILGKTNNNNYFSYNTKTNTLKEFTSEKDLLLRNSKNNLKLVDAIDFYYEKRNEIAGTESIAVGIVSLFLSLAAIYFTIKVILRLGRSKSIK